MKPEDLKYPCPRADQRIMVHDRIWYFPKGADDSSFVFSGWDHPHFFGNDRPVVVEYCSGNGAWIADKAAANPLVNWVAVERKFARVKKIWSKLKNNHLNNLFIICGEAHQTTERFFAESSLSAIYINFPDPWPKNRHAKHRLMQPSFVQELWRILKWDQSLTFVTDDTTYSQAVIDAMRQHGGFHSIYPEPFFKTEDNEYGTSYFDQLWRSKGCLIRYHRFKKEKVTTCM